MQKCSFLFVALVAIWFPFVNGTFSSFKHSPILMKASVVVYAKSGSNFNTLFLVLSVISIILTSVTIFMLLMNKRDVMCVLNGFIVLVFCSLMAINAEKYSRIWSVGKSLCKIYLILCFYWTYFMIHLFRFTSMIVCDRQSILMIFEKFAEYSPILSLGIPFLVIVSVLCFIKLSISPIYFVIPCEYASFVQIKWLNGVMFALLIIPGFLTSFLQFGIIYLLVYKRQSAKKKLFQSSLRKQDIVKCVVNLLSFFLFLIFQTLHFSGFVLHVSNFFNCLLGVLYFICFGLSSSFRTTYSQFFIRNKRKRTTSKFKSFEKRNSNDFAAPNAENVDIEARNSISSDSSIFIARECTTSSNASETVSKLAGSKCNFASSVSCSPSAMLNFDNFITEDIAEITDQKTQLELSNLIEEINTAQSSLCKSESGEK